MTAESEIDARMWLAAQLGMDLDTMSAKLAPLEGEAQ